MKNAAILFCLLFAACSVDPLESEIIRHLETVGNTRYDLKTKIISIDTLPGVTAKDSLPALLERLERWENVVLATKEIGEITGNRESIESIRARTVPQWLIRKIESFKQNPDSVLYLPYRVTARQKTGDLSKQFVVTVYTKDQKVCFEGAQ